MKTQRGITIASLIIYVVAMSIIVGIMAIVLSFYNKNVSGMNDTGDINLELSKFATKMIQETQEPGNNVTNLTATTITFKSGNTYIFQDNRIYQNNIEITNNVKEFQAKLETEGDKQLIKIYIVLGKGQAEVVKNLNYVVTATVDGGMVGGVYPGMVQGQYTAIPKDDTLLMGDTLYASYADVIRYSSFTFDVPSGVSAVRIDFSWSVDGELETFGIENPVSNKYYVPNDGFINRSGEDSVLWGVEPGGTYTLQFWHGGIQGSDIEIIVKVYYSQSINQSMPDVDDTERS